MFTKNFLSSLQRSLWFIKNILKGHEIIQKFHKRLAWSMNKSSYKAAVNPFKKHAILKKPNKSNSQDKHES